MTTNYSSSIQPWTLRMPAGSLQQWNFKFTTTDPGGTTPYLITGANWEYVVRSSATDTGTPVIDITTFSTGEGQIAVTDTDTLSQLLLTIAPVATVNLNGTYYHSLWMNPGTNSALAWMSGLLLVEGNPQP